MSGVVVVPCHRRPEFLQLCLENLSRCPESKEMLVAVMQDHPKDSPPSDENEKVVAGFSNLQIAFMDRPEHPFWGNTYNVLESYRAAIDSGAEFIFLVEEDIMVSPDFFNWHYRVQEKARPWCSIAVKHLDLKFPEGVAADPRYYHRVGQYASLGVCFRKGNLSSVMEHATEKFYNGLIPYLDDNFPNSRMRGSGGQQDGLISRIMEREKFLAAYPTRPRAFHAGYYGYNRGMDHGPNGSLEERVSHLRKSICNPNYMDLFNSLGDCTPCSLESVEWDGELVEYE